MARVILTGNLGQFTGGVTEVEVEAATVRALIRKLEEQFPGLGPQLSEGSAVAIDGEIYQDHLLEPIEPDSEVCFLPKIGGG